MNPSYSQPASHTGVGTALALAQNYTKLKRRNIWMEYSKMLGILWQKIFPKNVWEYWAKNLIMFFPISKFNSQKCQGSPGTTSSGENCTWKPRFQWIRNGSKSLKLDRTISKLNMVKSNKLLLVNMDNHLRFTIILYHGNASWHKTCLKIRHTTDFAEKKSLNLDHAWCGSSSLAGDYSPIYFWTFQTNARESASFKNTSNVKNKKQCHENSARAWFSWFCILYQNRFYSAPNVNIHKHICI